MKDKKNLYPILLLFITAISIYYLIQFRAQVGNDYDTYLAEARKASDGGLVTTAMENYQQAINLNPSDELYYEVGQMYIKNEDFWNAKRWYDRDMMEEYPKSALTYCLGVEESIAREDYDELFEVYQLSREREITDERIENLVNPYKSKFELSGNYEKVGGYSNTVACAPVYSEYSRWSYIDITGSTVIDNRYEKASVFGDYAAVIDEKGNPYLIDAEGINAISGKYLEDANKDVGKIEEFRDIDNGLILAKSEMGWGFYDSKTYELRFGGYKDATPFSNGVAAITKDGEKWALIGNDGSELTGYDYDSILSDFKECICRTDFVFAEKSAQYCLVNKDGTIFSEQQYGEVKAFNDNTLAAVNKAGKWVFLSPTGEEKNLGDFQEAESFSNGLAAVKNNGLWGYIDLEGNLVIDYQFTETTPMSRYGTAFVKGNGDRWSLLRFYYYSYNQ